MALRGGFSLVEVLIAIMLVSFIAVGGTRFISGSAHSNRDLLRQTAAVGVAQVYAERLRSLGPGGAAEVEFQVDAAGEVDEDGIYTVRIRSEVRCDGGAQMGEHPGGPGEMAADCGESRATLHSEVEVEYPRYAGALDTGAVRLPVVLGGLGRYAPPGS